MLKDPECLARCLDNSHDTINGDGRVAGQVELLQLSGRASDGEKIIIGDGHEASVAKDLQSPQQAEVYRLQWLQINEVIFVCCLLRSRVDALEFQRLEWFAGAGEHSAPGLGIHVTDGGPWKRERGDVGAVLERLEYQTVGLGGVEAVHPHALDLGGHLWVVVADAHSPLEGGEGVAVYSCASWTVNELVQRVALSPVGEFGPSLCHVSIMSIGGVSILLTSPPFQRRM